jgi:hypothetical protein
MTSFPRAVTGSIYIFKKIIICNCNVVK